MPTITELSDDFRQAVLRRETQAATRLVSSYSAVVGRLERETDRIIRRLQQLRDRGETPGPAILFQEGRLEALTTQARAQLGQFSAVAAGQTEAAQGTVVGRVPDDTSRLAVAAVGPAPSGPVSAIENAWNRLPANALEELIGRASDGSPLRAVFASVGAGVAEDVQNVLVAGLAAGRNPREIARNLRSAFGTGLNRALIISRTETLTAYREGTRRTYRTNTDIMEGWVWHSALGPRTCPACWAMHGTKHSVDERLDGHPNCRCAMVPLTRSWEELGFTGLPDTRPDVPMGTDLFRDAPPDIQERVLGHRGFEAYSRGDLRLTDFLARRNDPRWGTTRYARSVRAIGRGTGGFQVGAVVQGTFLPVPPTPGRVLPGATS